MFAWRTPRRLLSLLEAPLTIAMCQQQCCLGSVKKGVERALGGPMQMRAES